MSTVIHGVNLTFNIALVSVCNLSCLLDCKKSNNRIKIIYTHRIDNS